MKKPVRVLQRGYEIIDVVNMAAIVVETQEMVFAERNFESEVATAVCINLNGRLATTSEK